MIQFVNIYGDNNVEKLLSKIVVRRLPPHFTLDIFRKHVSPIPPHNYLNFVRADDEDQHSFSRAYINFIHYKDLLDFKEKYDNYVFLGQNGTEYMAVVEFAPFQNIPRKCTKRKDVKCGTIQYDNYYINFIESLKNKNKRIARSEFDLKLKTENKSVAVTPLLKYISEKRHEKKVAENGHNCSRAKIRENSIVFVNSTIKKNQKYNVRNRKPKFFNKCDP